VAAVDSLNLFLCLSLELELEHGEETRKVLCGSSLSLPFLYLCLLLRICGIWKWDIELGGGQVDAFTDSAFKGNPAAVCLLEEERDEHCGYCYIALFALIFEFFTIVIKVRFYLYVFYVLYDS
jgi:hypothetical protein